MICGRYLVILLQKKLGYTGTPVHRLVTDFVMQMGDVEKKDGTGGSCIVGSIRHMTQV